MGAHPPQNGGIGCDPCPHRGPSPEPRAVAGPVALNVDLDRRNDLGGASARAHAPPGKHKGVSRFEGTHVRGSGGKPTENGKNTHTHTHTHTPVRSLDQGSGGHCRVVRKSRVS